MRKTFGILIVAAAMAGAQEFTFAIIGDRTGSAQKGVYEQVWREVASSKPAFAINVGDSIEGLNDAKVESEWLAFKSILQPYKGIPFYFTPGNHDIWSSASRLAYEQATGRPAHYSFDFNGAHFIILDNSQSDSLPAGELEFLTRDLKQNRAKSPKFVFFHQPAWLVPVLFQNKQYPFHKLCKEYGVTHVVSAHVHKFGRFELEGVTYLLVGSSGGHLRGPRFEDGWFFHHVIAKVTKSEVELTVIEVSAPLGQGRRFNADRWREGKGPN